MPRQTPPHPGTQLRDEIDALGLTVNEAATGLGVTRSQLYRVIRGTSGISPEMAVRIEQAIGSTADFWLKWQATYDVALARSARPDIQLRRLVPKTP